MPKKQVKSHKLNDNLLFIKFQSLIGLTFILLAVVIFGSIKFDQFTHKPSAQEVQKLQTKNIETVKASEQFTREARSTDLPTEIVIPAVNISAKIIESQIIDGYWEVSETTASHGIGSAYPGEKGNSVIFAHAREGLFYNLRNVVKDDMVYVLTQNKWRKYKITDIKSVTPDQIDAVQPTKDETLTLFTCSGYQDEHRLIVVAKPVK